MKILFRCDGSHKVGLGHVFRCIVLADELKKLFDDEIIFAMKEGEPGIKIVEEKYGAVKPDEKNPAFDYEAWINNLLLSEKPDIFIIDARDRLSPDVLRNAKKDNVLIVDIDDPEDKRLAADLAFYPPVPQMKKLEWKEFKGQLFSGWEWVILRNEFSTRREYPENNKPSIINVLATMGGSDPENITVKALRALNKINLEMNVAIILGKGFRNNKEIDEILDSFKHSFEVLYDVGNMAEIMRKADIALASFGVTAYELAAMQVPALYLCRTKDHLESAKLFIHEKMAYGAWLYDEISEDDLTLFLTTYLKYNYLKKNMIKNNIMPIDGLGAKRVAKKIYEAYKDFLNYGKR